MIRTKQIHFHYTTFLVILLPMVFASCKREQDNSPTPEPTTVTISDKDYPISKIGAQVWTVVNYSGPGGIAYGSGNEKPEYGRYYTFEEAKAIPVPTGWRLPTRQDYVTLAENQGIIFTAHRATGQEAIKKLVSTSNWRTMPGNNTSGFNAQPAGYIYENLGPTDGDISEFWAVDGSTFSIQESAAGKAHNIAFYGNGGDGYRFNVRFIKDK